MASGKLFGTSPVGTVALVERPVSQWYIRRARLTFLVVSFTTAIVSCAVVAMVGPLLLAVVLCIPLGMVLGLVAGVLVRVWPVLRVLWWWSFEVAAVALLTVGPSLLARATYPWLALAVVLLLAAVCGLVGPVRRFVAAWSWCLVVRHRLRLCFAGIVRGSGGVRPGSLPLVLWARTTPAGERCWLWLRPGLSLDDLEQDGKVAKIAVACWAGEVRVVRASRRYAALLRVDVARRDPLAGLVTSPLALLIDKWRRDNEKNDTEKAGAPVSPAAPPPVGLDLADIEEPAPEPPTRGGRR